MKSGEHERALRDLLADLSAGEERALVHLLTCPLCYQRATTPLGEQESQAEIPGTAALWDRLEADVPDLVERAGRSYAEAEELLAELATYAAEEQHKVLRETRFHSRFLLEMLLDHSQAAQPRDPELAEHLAGLAGSLAARLFRNEPEAEEESALSQAAAESLAGNARRLLGRQADAKAAFSRAAHCLSHCWGPSSASASFCRFLGLLRWEQGRLDEAEALSRQAGSSAQAFFVGCRRRRAPAVLPGRRRGAAQRLPDPRLPRRRAPVCLRAAMSDPREKQPSPNRLRHAGQRLLFSGSCLIAPACAGCGCNPPG